MEKLRLRMEFRLAGAKAKALNVKILSEKEFTKLSKGKQEYFTRTRDRYWQHQDDALLLVPYWLRG